MITFCNLFKDCLFLIMDWLKFLNFFRVWLNYVDGVLCFSFVLDDQPLLIFRYWDKWLIALVPVQGASILETSNFCGFHVLFDFFQHCKIGLIIIQFFARIWVLIHEFLDKWVFKVHSVINGLILFLMPMRTLIIIYDPGLTPPQDFLSTRFNTIYAHGLKIFSWRKYCFPLRL